MGIEELRDEAMERADEKREFELCSNYTEFVKYFDDEFARVKESIEELKALHEKYGHDFEIREIL